MFLTSSAKPIDSTLNQTVAKIEQQSTSLSVLAARQFRYQVKQTAVEVTISEPRQFNVLEEFVLRAVSELIPSPTKEELANVLGLDSVFVDRTVINLQALKMLEDNAESKIQITKLGRDFYTQGSVPQETKTEKIYAISDSLAGNIYFQSHQLTSQNSQQFSNLSDFIDIDNYNIDISTLSLTEIQNSIQNSGLGLHIPSESKIITDYQIGDLSLYVWQKLSIFVIFDVLENKLKLEARNKNKILDNITHKLNILLNQNKIDLSNICKLTDSEIKDYCEKVYQNINSEVETRIEQIRQTVREKTKITQSNSQTAETGTVTLLRGSDITKEFQNSLDSATSQIIIFSPWISQKVIDNNFIEKLQKLADKGVWILIGYGIAKTQSAEDRKIPEEVFDRLQKVLTPEKIPAVQIFWLGSSHAKEVIIDRKIHLNVSNNMLSCPADWHLWDEAGYKVTIPEQVQAAYQYYAQCFQTRAEKLWQKAIEKHNRQAALQALRVWGALGMEKSALAKLQQSNWDELMSDWLKIVCQSQRYSNNSV
ncbi:MAG: hypothetical protein QNJ47_04765 [Nostocaceae cyanobacterium]|nr:hypothetical protein [Nostocaceae cyanobacterium]